MLIASFAMRVALYHARVQASAPTHFLQMLISALCKRQGSRSDDSAALALLQKHNRAKVLALPLSLELQFGRGGEPNVRAWVRLTKLSQRAHDSRMTHVVPRILSSPDVGVESRLRDRQEHFHAIVRGSPGQFSHRDLQTSARAAPGRKRQPDGRLGRLCGLRDYLPRLTLVTAHDL